MEQDKKTMLNEHLKQNASSDTEEDVRRRRRMAELEKEHKAKAQSAPAAKR